MPITCCSESLSGYYRSVLAVTFDFYNTLVHHRAGTGRGHQYRQYLAAAGFISDPWEHRVLYDVFEYYAACYRSGLAEEAKLRFWIEFTRRLFERTNVRAVELINYAAHAPAIREIMGPSAFALFDEVKDVLCDIKQAGLRLAVISDWPRGLEQFCDELGILGFFDAVVVSSEAGYQKPDPRLFEIARERLQVSPNQIIHVGDQREDIDGALAAGFSPVLLVRGGQTQTAEIPVISNLGELMPLLNSANRSGAPTIRDHTERSV